MSTYYDPHLYEGPLLGAAMMSPDLALSLTEHLRPEDFVIGEHRAAWAAVMQLSKEPDTLNLVDVAERSGVDVAYLAQLARDCHSTDAKVVGAWREVIQEKARLHRLQGNFAALIEESQQSGASVADITRKAAGYVISLEAGAEQQQKRTRQQVLNDRLNAFSDRYEGIADPVGLRTGVGEFDQLAYGLGPGKLTLLAARPAMGKSAFAMQIARLAAKGAEHPVAFISLEMDQDELFDRWLVQESRIHASEFQRGKGMDPHNIDRLGAAAKALQDANLESYDDIFDIEGIVAKCEALHRRHGGLALVVVDYLQLVGTRGPKPSNRAQEVGEYSRALKLLAMRLHCPVLALSQLNRGVEERADKRPLMADLRESGSLEQDADKIGMLYRDEVYHEHSQDAGIAEIILRKHRGGPIGTVRCLADMARFTFSDITSDQVRQQAASAGVDAFS